MRFLSLRHTMIIIGIAVAIVAAGYVAREPWIARVSPTGTAADAEPAATPVDEPKVLQLSAQARKNLGVVSKPATLQAYWRKIQVPAAIVDRPGRSDRGITSPAVGVVTRVHAFPGDMVKPGDLLFTLRLFSEYLQNTQKELFSSARETEFIQAELRRVSGLADRGAIAGAKIIDLENQLQRQEAVIQAHRQDLLTRGLNPEQIKRVAEGQFVSTVDVVAPPLVDTGTTSGDFVYEVQELAAELGQQVQAGQLLSTLANHHTLYIEGHAFKREAPFLETAAQRGWNVDVEFAEDDPAHWPELNQRFEIRHLGNAIDTESRTFDFYIPLSNQSRSYKKGDETFIVWRFRPGQRVRLHVPVEELKGVFVFPAGAVAREGPETYVFQQNGDLFHRIPVNVVHEDRRNVVVANDGSVKRGLYLAQRSAASLNRVLKAQAASGMRADVHVHADGTVHASH